MLVVSRKRSEVIHIGEDVEVMIVEIRGDKVRLGITAPRELAVHRREVFDALHHITREIPRQSLPCNCRKPLLSLDEQMALLVRDGQIRLRMADGNPIHAIEEEMDLEDAIRAAETQPKKEETNHG